MPYAGAQSTGTLSVANVSFTLSANKRSAAPGDTVTFSGTITANGSPVANDIVGIAIVQGNVTDWIVTNLTTDSNGNFSFQWTVPWSDSALGTFPCNDFTFQAYESIYYMASNTVQVAINYPTRLTIGLTPSQVGAGQKFTVSGTLQYYDGSNWNALANQTITITLGSTSTTATTDSYGNYKVQLTAPSTPGTYTVVASYAGTAPMATTSVMAALGVGGGIGWAVPAAIGAVAMAVAFAYSRR